MALGFDILADMILSVVKIFFSIILISEIPHVTDVLADKIFLPPDMYRDKYQHTCIIQTNKQTDKQNIYLRH